MGRKRYYPELPIGVQQVLDSLSAPVVTIFVRHSADCKHKDDESFQHCNCRKHLRWFQDGKLYRQTTSARSWEAAEKAKTQVEEGLADRARQRAQRQQTMELHPSPADLSKFLVWEGGKRTPQEIAKLLELWENANRTPELMQSEFFTPAEVANILKVSEQTVYNRFAEFPGVIDIGSEETRFKRRYRVLRIPRHVFQKFLIANRVERRS